MTISWQRLVHGPDDCGGGDPAPTFPSASTGLTVSGTTLPVSPARNAVSGASGYRVYRAGTQVAAVTGTTAPDRGTLPRHAVTGYRDAFAVLRPSSRG